MVYQNESGYYRTLRFYAFCKTQALLVFKSLEPLGIPIKLNEVEDNNKIIWNVIDFRK